MNGNGMYHIFCAVDDGDTFPFPEKSLFWMLDKNWFARYTVRWKYFHIIYNAFFSVLSPLTHKAHCMKQSEFSKKWSKVRGGTRISHYATDQ